MKCPFCRVEFHPSRSPNQVGLGPEGHYMFLIAVLCPSCDQVSVYLERITNIPQMMNPASVEESTLIWPKTSSRPPAPPEVPAQYAEDYNQAALILPDSPKASAALTRRCMQN